MQIDLTEKSVIEHNSRPIYKANSAGQVMKRSIGEYNPETKTASYSAGFPVCEVGEYVEPRHGTAALIARLLNENEVKNADK